MVRWRRVQKPAAYGLSTPLLTDTVSMKSGVRDNPQLFRASSRSSLSLSGRTMPVPVETGEKPYIW